MAGLGGDWRLSEADADRDQALAKRLTELLEPVVRLEGLVLVELNWRREGKGWVLRLIVDRTEGGVTLEECSLISRQVSRLMDVEDVIPVSYHLEVSSPGLTRRLKTPREYELFAGRPVRLVVKEPDGKTSTLKGLLKGMMGQEVIVESEGRMRAVALDSVAKARLDMEP